MTNKLNTNLNNTKLKIIADLFKQHPEYVDLLKKNDLSTLYRQINSFMKRWWVTELLYSAGIDPLDYLSFVPGYFISDYQYTLNLILPNNILNINNNAFFDCYLSSITFGKNVYNIGDGAFGACPNLEKVEFNSKLAEIGSEIFRGCINLTSIDYQGSKNQWGKINKNADWAAGSNIQRIVCTDGIIEL